MFYKENKKFCKENVNTLCFQLSVIACKVTMLKYSKNLV